MSAFDGPAAVAMMMHAVGHMERNGRYTREPYRNHFCASSEDAPTWDVLVSMGLATCREVRIPGCETTYFVTKAGLAFLRELRKAEKAARAK